MEFKQSIEAEENAKEKAVQDAEKARYEAIKLNTPTKQFGHNDHETELAVIISITVTLIGAFLGVIIAYCVYV